MVANRTPKPPKRTRTFTDSREGRKGTKEWSDYSYNICIGCQHHCRYCFAWSRAGIYKRNERLRDPAEWAKQAMNPNRTTLGTEVGKKGVVMFPTTHDITPDFLPQCLQTIRNLLANDNKVLVVSKPHLEVVRTLCKELVGHEDCILFRFTIGSLDEKTCAFWEPGAPTPKERIEALRHAYKSGFKTSVSMEPMLEDLDGTRAVVDAVEPFVTDTIWLGKMNRMPRERNKGVPGFPEAARKIDAQRKDDKILALVDAFAAHPKVRWKDSIKKLLKKHGKSGSGSV